MYTTQPDNRARKAGLGCREPLATTGVVQQGALGCGIQPGTLSCDGKRKRLQNPLTLLRDFISSRGKKRDFNKVLPDYGLLKFIASL